MLYFLLTFKNDLTKTQLHESMFSVVVNNDKSFDFIDENDAEHLAFRLEEELDDMGIVETDKYLIKYIELY